LVGTVGMKNRNDDGGEKVYYVEVVTEDVI
jgi:hypothetical protein